MNDKDKLATHAGAAAEPVAWWRVSYIDRDGNSDADVQIGKNKPTPQILADNGFPWEPLYGAPLAALTSAPAEPADPFLSREAFIAAYAKGSKLTREEFDAHFIALPCECGADECAGWAAVSKTPRDIMIYMGPKLFGEYRKECRAPAETPPAAGAIDARGQEVEWGDPKTVGMFIRQLQTIAPETPIHAAVHTDIDGKRVALTKPVTISRERVSGRRIRQGDESVPYSVVVWAQQDQLAASRPEAPAAAGAALAVAQVSEVDGKKCVTFCSYKALYETPLWTKLYALAATPAPEVVETASKMEVDSWRRALLMWREATVPELVENPSGLRQCLSNAARLLLDHPALKAAQPIERESGK